MLVTVLAVLSVFCEWLAICGIYTIEYNYSLLIQSQYTGTSTFHFVLRAKQRTTATLINIIHFQVAIGFLAPG